MDNQTFSQTKNGVTQIDMLHSRKQESHLVNIVILMGGVIFSALVITGVVILVIKPFG